MNIFLILGMLVISGYLAGKVLELIKFPKIIGYIAVGVLFSPNTLDLLNQKIIEDTNNLQAICLGFITFAIGGELKWSKIQEHQREILNITFLASLIPFILLVAGFFVLSFFIPIADGAAAVLAFAILLGALASPTDPSATLAVIHEYKVKGNVRDTILGVAALDDGLGILFFSIAAAAAAFISGNSNNLESSVLNTLYHIGGGIVVGIGVTAAINLLLHFMKIKSEGQWIVFIFSLIAICHGTSVFFGFDELLACMVMGATVANTNPDQDTIFQILERYTEELIFLFFFVISGLYLDISSVSVALIPILVFVLLRIVGKFAGGYIGGKWANASKPIQKYTGGGLVPQGGVVIGLALSLLQNEAFEAFSELLLTIVMGATVINEVVGPILAKNSLQKAGEVQK